MRRRFPPPWTINEHNDACFKACALCYFEDEAGNVLRRSC
jgi:hypothetical protein